MKKTFVGILLLSASFLGITGFSSKHGSQIGNYVHDVALVTFDNSSQINLKNLRGKYTLLNFWNTNDASSRLNMKQYQMAFGSDSMIKSGVNYIAINTDADIRMAEAMLQIDRIDDSISYRCKNNASDVIKKFSLSHGMKCFLLDPQGEIVAINPSVELLKSLH